MTINEQTIKHIVSNCSGVPYQPDTRDKILNDIASIDHHIACAQASLAFLESIKFDRLQTFGRGGVSINVSSNSSGISGRLRFGTKKSYYAFAMKSFFDLLTEISIIADITATLIKEIYSLKYPSTMSFPNDAYLVPTLQLVQNSTQTTDLQNYINTNLAIIDFNHFLPGTGDMNEDLSNCNYSYQLVRRLRNVHEHNSIEDIIQVLQSRGVFSGESPNHYAEITSTVDLLCRTPNCFASLSGGKDGSRDVLVFGRWALSQHIDAINQIMVCIEADS